MPLGHNRRGLSHVTTPRPGRVTPVRGETTMDDGADGGGGRRGGISARLTRYGAFLGTALAIASLLTLAGPAVTAEAASYCSGRVVRTVPFSGGEVVVHKKAGYVCAATVARRSGPRRAMSVGVQARGNREVLDRAGTAATPDPSSSTRGTAASGCRAASAAARCAAAGSCAERAAGGSCAGRAAGGTCAARASAGSCAGRAAGGSRAGCAAAGTCAGHTTGGSRAGCAAAEHALTSWPPDHAAYRAGEP